MQMEKIINAIIVDDEVSSRETLTGMISAYCPEIRILGEAGGLQDGIATIESFKPDLVFLDIEMPFGTGFDLLEQLDEINFEIIFTTAYNQYAIKAIKIAALDYMLKPIDPKELQEAVQKLKNKNSSKQHFKLEVLSQLQQEQLNDITRIAVPSAESLDIVEVEDISYCQSVSNYTIFFLGSGQQLVSSKTLKEYESLLPPKKFLRVHQSYLVNLLQVKKYFKGRGGMLELKDGTTIDVARDRKARLLEAINTL